MSKKPRPKANKPASSKKALQKAQSNSLRIQGEFHQGPLPSPQVLQGYDNIVQGAAERILSMAEQQAGHRQDLEKIVVTSGSRDSLLGLIFALVIGLGYAGGSVLCILNGYQVGGTIVGSTCVATLAGVFVYGSKQRRDERADKLRRD